MLVDPDPPTPKLPQDLTMMRRRKLAWTAILLGAFAVAVWANNSSWLHGAGGDRHGEAGPRSMTLLAHRGVHQTFSREGLTRDGCTATRIHPPTHNHLENTLASMEAAFGAGASIVELDIHPTTDGHFAVFHDWTVDCRTEGKGVTRTHSLAALKALDIGYGYTADGGKTFPFRGQGVGMMPSLDEVLARFPGKRFLINIKSNDPVEGELLAARLARLAPAERALLMAYGGDRPIAKLREKLPDIPVMSVASLKRCMMRYIGVGWTGYLPEACRDTLLLLPVNIAPWIWGFPHRFIERMRAAGTSVFVSGRFEGGEFTTGIDDEVLLRQLPAGYDGGVWTNRIEAIGPLLKN
jgi:glycerophosphoryl diester phosphodiesterase